MSCKTSVNEDSRDAPPEPFDASGQRELRPVLRLGNLDTSSDSAKNIIERYIAGVSLLPPSLSFSRCIREHTLELRVHFDAYVT